MLAEGPRWHVWPVHDNQQHRQPAAAAQQSTLARPRQACAHASASQLSIWYVTACQCKLPAAGCIPSRSKFHITVGHSTVMGETQFFGVPDGQGQPPAAALPALIKRVGQLATKVSSLGSCCWQVKPGRRQACSQGLQPAK